MYETHWDLAVAEQKDWYNEVMSFAEHSCEEIQDGDTTIVLTHDEDEELVAVRFY